MPAVAVSPDAPLFSADTLISLTAIRPLAERLLTRAPGSPESNLGCCLAAVFGAVGETIARRDPAMIEGLSDAIARWVEGRL